MAKYGAKAQSKVEQVMRERKAGTLRSGKSGKKVRSRKQAIAIGLSEARREGTKVPAKKSATKSAARKSVSKSAAKQTGGRKSATRKSAAKKRSRKSTGTKTTRQSTARKSATKR